MKIPTALLAIVGLILSIQFLSCNSTPGVRNKNAEEGYNLAKKYCKSCHQFPQPELLDKNTWTQFVLPKMGSFFGFRYMGENAYFEGENQAISLEDWSKVLLYYYLNASPNPGKRPTDVNIKTDLDQFSVDIPQLPVKSAATTMVMIDTTDGMMEIGDGSGERLYEWASGKVLDSLKVGVGISNLRKTKAADWILTMGVLHPSDERSGKLVVIDRQTKNQLTILDSLKRPVYASYADLNNDSLEDIVICEFGDITGALSWFENKGDNHYEQHTLRALPGAIETAVYDFNNDGRPDIIALMAQGDEGFFLYYNLGGGRFREERLLQLPPSYGSNSFQLADFNKDGFPDIIATNGDNGDYPPVLKAYHGIRIYLNDGNNRFAQKVFLPVNGVGKVIAQDFDQDGDLDLASIAFFPDYLKTPQEAFIYWENKGELSFAPASFKEVSAGRWLTMDVGDIDGDGDLDIVLGNANFRVGNVPGKLQEKWDLFSPPVVVLVNQLNRKER